MRPCAPKTHTELAHEWDQLAEERHRQLVCGEDLSFQHVLLPMTLDLLEGADASVIADIGSGTGYLTAQLSRVAGRVIAVEPSIASVRCSRQVLRHCGNVRFVEANVEEAAQSLARESVTAAVAAMSVMTTPSIGDFAKAVAQILRRGGTFIATLPHPWFWPKYWGYESEQWFEYYREIFIEAPFAISKCRTSLVTTHVHRPLSAYTGAFARNGFCLNAVLEPMPPAEVHGLYPASWQFPRFLGMRWAKVQ